MKSAFSGPLISYGSRANKAIGGTGSTNPDRAPSMAFEGWGLMDHRASYNQNRPGVLGWYGDSAVICVLDVAPLVLQTNGYATVQVPVAGTALTLTAGTGVTAVATGGLTVWSSGNVVPAGSMVCNGAPTIINSVSTLTNPFTGTGAVNFYSPATLIARNVTVTSVGVDTSATFVVRGYDVYGFPMSETITGATSGATAAGKKAFKFVTSVTPAGTLSGSNVSVGYGDVIGFNLKALTFGYTSIVYNNTLATSTTTPFGTASAFAFADNTVPQTATTGDVRGTINLGTANPSNGTRILQIFITPSMLQMVATGGLFGQPQFTS